MLERVWRYVVEDKFGGIVFADTKEEAEYKVKARYSRFLDSISNVLVWKIEEDDFFDAENPDVLDCYGI